MSVPDQLYFYTLSINQVTKNDTQAFLMVEVLSDHNKKLLLCKVETGAEENVISLGTYMYKLLFPNSSCNPGGIPLSFKPSSTIITAFGGHAVGHHGTCVLKLDYNGSCKSYPFHVVDADGPTILGLPTCTDLNLVTMNFSITNHEGAFDLSATQTQLLKSSCSNCTRIALKVLVAFRANITLQ